MPNVTTELDSPANDLAVIDDVWAPLLARIGAWIVFPLCAVLTVIHLWSASPDYARAVATGTLSLVGLIAIFLLQQERYRAGFMTMIVGGWLAATLLVSVSGGLYSNNVAIYPLIILIAGLFLGTRTAWIIAGITIVTALALAAATAGWDLAVPPRKALVFPLGTLLSVILMSAFGTWAFSRFLQERIENLRQETASRKQAQSRLLEANEQMALLNGNLEAMVDERTRELRETATRLQQIIDTIDSGLLVWSPERKLVLWNEAFTRMFPATAVSMHPGAERDEIGRLMRSTGDLVAADDPAAGWDSIGKHEISLTSGRILEINRLETLNGGRLVMHSDVTELRRHRQILSRNERMAALGNLVAGVAHEINTPLGNALMVSSTLEDLIRDFDKTRGEGTIKRSTFDEFVRKVHEANDQLLRNLRRSADLVLHFKQVAVDQTSDRRRSFDLASGLEDIQATVSNRVRKAGHHIEVDCPPELRMDSYPGALAQIVTNLVENAIIHGFDERTGGTIRLSARADGENHVLITFSDDGQGIPEAHRDRIFDPFFTTRLGTGGSGLGLSIVLSLTRDVLGGEVSVDSSPAFGTTFVFRLPRLAPSKPDPSSPPA